jgi:nitrite reductase/ring-hydroxylating ferredoxin subunit/putative sterol carrier protein
MARNLPPIPHGWFIIRFSEDLAPGQVQRLHYFGRELVLYRTESGQAVLVDPYCPHLGAHLGYGGQVQGETIQCPFHHWRFDASGACIDVPNCDRIPPKARTRPWTLLEQNGLIRAWFHPDGAPPSFSIPAVDDEPYTKMRTTHWRIRSHPQEIGENTVDTAHMMPIHHTQPSKVIQGPDADGPRLKLALNFMASAEIIGMEGENDVVLDLVMYGLGEILVDAHIRNVDLRARYRVCSTPVDAETTEIFGTVALRKTDDPQFTAEAADLFYEAYTKDFVKDFPIWENKVYRAQPCLSGADGPIGAYRRWAKQFYPVGAARRSDEAATSTAAPRLVQASRRVADRALHAASSLLSRVRAAIDGGGAEVPSPSPSPSRVPSPPRAAATADRRHVPRVDSLEDYFATLDERFVAEASRGIDAVFQWEVGAHVKHAIVHDGTMALHDGPHTAPTVTISMDGSEYVDVVNGDVNGPRAFTVGSGKVSGKLRMAMKMQRIFPAASPRIH